MNRSKVVVIAGLVLACSSGVHAARPYPKVVMDVANMVESQRATSLAEARGLSLLNVLWEDTGRYLGSSVGPNISDVTIEVDFKDRRGRVRSALMPVMRYPNFEDKTGDLKLRHFFVRVGNERQSTLRTIPLAEYLSHPAEYMSLPERGRIKGETLLAKRDRHVLVSAQAAFLPIPREGEATFRPVIFNYQSYRKHPAVLVILATREGTSMTIVDNARDSLGPESWGQRLFFNAGGQRAPLTAERLSDVERRGTTSGGDAASTLGEDANMLLLIQVPLKQRELPRRMSAAKCAEGAMADSAPATRDRGRSDVEAAVLGHGPLEGPFTELDDLTIERDPRFPIRVTVQFYQATSNGVISGRDVGRLARQIGRVYRKADFVGSLVVPAGQPRPTEWDGVSPPPADLTIWRFPGLVERTLRWGWVGPWRLAPPELRASLDSSARSALDAGQRLARDLAGLAPLGRAASWVQSL